MAARGSFREILQEANKVESPPWLETQCGSGKLDGANGNGRYEADCISARSLAHHSENLEAEYVMQPTHLITCSYRAA